MQQASKGLRYINCLCFIWLFLSGLLNPLDSPHHMRMDDESEYREGVVVDRTTKPGRGSLVNCGMRKVSVFKWRLPSSVDGCYVKDIVGILKKEPVGHHLIIFILNILPSEFK